MRVTDQQMAQQMKDQIDSAYTLMSQTQTQLATGKRINTPSDDPVGTAVVLDLQGRLAQNTQFSTTATDTQQWLQTTDSALSGVSTALTQARTLGVQAANQALTLDEQQAIATNIAQLIQQAVDSANGSYAGRYVLSGTQTTTLPFSYNSANNVVSYQGDSAPIQREISPGVMMTINTSGGAALNPAFAAMTKLYQDVQSGNSSQISADLAPIDSAQSQLMVSQANVGASLNRIQAVQTSLQSTNFNLTSQSSNLSDVDFASASVDFSERQAAYQAILQASAKVVQPSLIEFLK